MTEKQDDPDDKIEQLVRKAGLRQQPPEELEKLIRADSRLAWQATVTQHRRQQWQRTGLSIAAGLVLVTSLIFYSNETRDFQVNVLVASNIQLNDVVQDAGVLNLTPGSEMLAVDPARLTTDTGVELRLEKSTRISWLTANEVYLESGAIYVDTHDKASFDVDTREGHIHDIGTRYLIVSNADGVELAVREGEAEVTTESNSIRVRGDGTTAQVLHLGHGQSDISNEPASDVRWEWIHQLTPDYPDESVQTLLAIICESLGKHLIFDSPGVETSTVNLRLASGSLRGLTPSEALKVVAEISGLRLIENATEVRIAFSD